MGKAIKENLVLGFNAGLTIYINDVEPNYVEYDTKSYKAGVFLEKYKSIATSGFYLFIQGGCCVSWFNQEKKGTFFTPDETKRLTVVRPPTRVFLIRLTKNDLTLNKESCFKMRQPSSYV